MVEAADGDDVAGGLVGGARPDGDQRADRAKASRPRGGRIVTAVLRDTTHWDEVVTVLGYEHPRPT